MRIIWQEFKLLDKSTNSSTRIQMIRQLIRFGNDVKYYCSYKFGKKYYNLDDGIIKYLNITGIPKVRYLAFCLKLFLLNLGIVLLSKADVVMIDYIVILVAWPVILLAKLLNKPVKFVMDVRTLPVSLKTYSRDIRIFKLALVIASKLCEGITFITPFMREYLSNYLEIKKPTAVWSSGFDTEIFDSSRFGSLTKNNGCFQLFYHGGLSVSRGILELIKSAQILRGKGYDIELRLIGNIVDRDAIVGYMDKSNMKHYCFLEEPVPYADIPQLIASCDLPVIPLSHFIGWRVSSPIKLMEYLAMGKSVVVTDIEAHRDVMGGAKFAFYAKTEKAEDLVVAIKQAYENRDLLRSYGREARQLALEKYTWERQAQNLVEFLNTL